MNRTSRLLIVAIAVVLLAGIATAAVLRSSAGAGAQRDRAQAGTREAKATLSLAEKGDRRLVFRNMVWGEHRDEVSSVPAGASGKERAVSGLKCLRFYAAAGTGVCLQQRQGKLRDSHRALVLDANMGVVRTLPLAGIPTRARVSPSGSMVAYTVFIRGESYTSVAFSTRTSIVDTRNGTHHANLEEYAVTKEGRHYKSPDINIWGVTFIDDAHFYATMVTKGVTYLVKGDTAARTLSTLRRNAECPSLSPDGTRLVYKKRVSGLPAHLPWQLFVLDLRTGQERPIAERRSVDDQVLWADDETLLYEVPNGANTHLWTVPADGSGRPVKVLSHGSSPAYVN
ncbi:TolB family protein [Streptomyces sp. NPDC054887]